ncbi:hypothetical protein [Sphingomonas sp. 3-13AW]|uniref:hypothetical protein n=1 Tax=Sphingomonas sp. 3-13AW TaxID=3050450 RepID=UPI003BB80ECE
MKGEKTFDACGERWTMFFGNAAQCSIEEAYDKGFFAVIQDVMPGADPAWLLNPEAYASELAAVAREIRMKDLRDLAWHGLRKHHPGLSLDDVSDIADDLGQQAFGEVVGTAIRATQDTAAEPGKGGAAKKPKTPRQKRTG